MGKLNNFLHAVSLVNENVRDGEITGKIMCEYGWSENFPGDWNIFVAGCNTYTQAEILHQLFEQFANLTPRDRDHVFGIFIWNTDDPAFFRLVETNPKVQQILQQIFADEEALALAMRQFGCGMKDMRWRVHYCWEMVGNGFTVMEV